MLVYWYNISMLMVCESFPLKSIDTLEYLCISKDLKICKIIIMQNHQNN